MLFFFLMPWFLFLCWLFLKKDIVFSSSFCSHSLTFSLFLIIIIIIQICIWKAVPFTCPEGCLHLLGFYPDHVSGFPCSPTGSVLLYSSSTSTEFCAFHDSVGGEVLENVMESEDLHFFPSFHFGCSSLFPSLALSTQ